MDAKKISNKLHNNNSECVCRPGIHAGNRSYLVCPLDLRENPASPNFISFLRIDSNDH